LFAMGPLLYAIAETCAEIECTMILIHHGSRPLSKHYEPMELTDLAFAGLPEFARQWLLINRLKAYEPGSGIHDLWLSVGGSTGQGGLWAVHIDEGRLEDDFSGRKWEVTIQTAGESREASKATAVDQKTAQKTKKDKQDDGALLVTLDKLDP